VGFAPLPDALDLGRTCEVIAVSGLVEPATLAGSLAGLAARGLGTVTLVPDAAWVRIKKGLTVLALAFGAWTSHEPASPQAHHLKIATETEESEEKKSGPKKIEADGRRREISHVGKKTAQPTRSFQPDRLIVVSGYR
jgi:hypothetical protein